MKKVPFLIIIFWTFGASAQINVLCSNSGGAINCTSPSPSFLTSQTVSRVVAAPTGGSRPSSEMSINNINNDIAFLQATSDSPTSLLSVLTDNKGLKSQYTFTVNGAISPQGVVRNADDLNLLGDVFGQITVDVSGYNGTNGHSAAQLCLAQVDQGFFGDARADDTLKTYANQGNLLTCDSGMLNAIAAAAPPTFCPSGFTYRPDLSGTTTQSFMINRRTFMNECIKTIATCPPNTPPSDPGCIANGGLFNPDFVFTLLSNSCPAGYSLSGPTQSYPCPHEGDDPNCLSNNETEACSTASCPTGIIENSFQTAYGATVTLEPGQSGSFGGKVNLMIYDVDNTNFIFSNGSNGSVGLNDLISEPSFTKYCVQILDNTTATLDQTAPERNVPSVNLDVITFFPLKVVNPSGLPNILFPVRAESDAVGLFKKMDSSARDYIFHNIIQTAP